MIGNPGSPAALRAGGIALLLGGFGGGVVNALHPTPPARTDELLALVATVPYWRMLHYGAVPTALAIVAGLALLVRTLEEPAARALGEIGKYVTALGAGAFIVAIVVDGHGYPAFAERWAAAVGAEKQAVLLAAGAVHAVDVALFPVWAGLFLGLGVLFVAAALWRAADYARGVTAVGIAGAVMCFAYALAGVLGTTVPLPIWPLGPAVVTLWIILLGGAMVRRSLRRAAGAPT